MSDSTQNLTAIGTAILSPGPNDMIEVAHVFKGINGQKILSDISLKVSKGEIMVILGGSGAGKTVLLQHMIGLMKPDAGRIFIGGQDITHLSEKELLLLRRKIGYLFQDGALYDFMNIYENVAFPLKEHTDFDEATIDQKVKEILAEVELSGAMEKLPSELSGGMRKRAALARAVILGSQYLFCDEPTSGLDPILSRDISDLILSISRKLKCTTVITSHDIPNSLRIADRVALMYKGKLVMTGTKKEFLASQDPVVREFVSSFSESK